MIKILIKTFLWCLLCLGGSAFADQFTDDLAAEEARIRDEASSPAQVTTERTEDLLDKRKEFLDDLNNHHRGTYSLYMKLPEAAKEEVFKAYLDGAPIKDIRKMVADRTLNR